MIAGGLTSRADRTGPSRYHGVDRRPWGVPTGGRGKSQRKSLDFYPRGSNPPLTTTEPHGIHRNRDRSRAAATAGCQKAKEAKAGAETGRPGSGREEGGATDRERVQYVLSPPLGSWDSFIDAACEQISGTISGQEVIEKTATQSTRKPLRHDRLIDLHTAKPNPKPVARSKKTQA